MKGIVFTEFTNLVEEKWGIDMVDALFDACELESGGAYTSVGTYNHEELVQMVVVLSEKTGLPANSLVFTFGLYLAETFSKKFPGFFAEVNNSFDFFKRVDRHIHVEVRKLYPDAELPKFYYQEPNANQLILHYESTRGFAELAHGLMEGVARLYGEKLNITRETQNNDKTFHEIFTIQRQP